jgi:hypothetical protein
VKLQAIIGKTAVSSMDSFQPATMALYSDRNDRKYRCIAGVECDGGAEALALFHRSR